jgi:hypothetical protein
MVPLLRSADLSDERFDVFQPTITHLLTVPSFSSPRTIRSPRRMGAHRAKFLVAACHLVSTLVVFPPRLQSHRSVPSSCGAARLLSQVSFDHNMRRGTKYLDLNNIILKIEDPTVQYHISIKLLQTPAAAAMPSFPPLGLVLTW